MNLELLLFVYIQKFPVYIYSFPGYIPDDFIHPNSSISRLAGW